MFRTQSARTNHANGVTHTEHSRQQLSGLQPWSGGQPLTAILNYSRAPDTHRTQLVVLYKNERDCTIEGLDTV